MVFLYLYRGSHSYSMYLHYYAAAFTGKFCEEDRNGCSEIQCFDGVECMDVPAPGVGAVCGACPPGYTGDAQKCYGQCLLKIPYSIDNY